MIKTQEALAMVGGHVNEELLLRNEYLAIENEILRNKLQRKISFSNCERIRLAKLGKSIEIKFLRDIAMIVKPETILTWYRNLVASKLLFTFFSLFKSVVEKFTLQVSQNIQMKLG